MIEMAFFITAFTTLFVVIDPFGTAPIFVALFLAKVPSSRSSWRTPASRVYSATTERTTSSGRSTSSAVTPLRS